MQKYIAIDEEGFFLLPPNLRVSDPVVGAPLINQMKIDDNFTITTVWDGENVIVEPFDKPLIVQQVHRGPAGFQLEFAYKISAPLNPESLSLDDKDRFHGLTADNMPFVFSRKAQAEFFNLLTDFDDDSITVDGKRFEIPTYYLKREDIGEVGFWSQKYQSGEKLHWDLKGPHPALDPILPQIKIVKSRIVNYGCGYGHDAAFMASKGHIVTGVDVSIEALADAKKTYGHLPNLHFEQGDVFKTTVPCDLILEHTLYCAISPEKRRDLVVRWNQSLEANGYLLGIFFVMPKRHGPPYGGSEWELRNHLEKYFRLLYWKRWELSPPGREGKELVVFAQKITKN